MSLKRALAALISSDDELDELEGKEKPKPQARKTPLTRLMELYKSTRERVEKLETKLKEAHEAGTKHKDIIGKLEKRIESLESTLNALQVSAKGWVYRSDGRKR